MLSEDNLFIKEKLRKLLQTNVVEVKFTKKDGSDRTMNCTLDPKRLPSYPLEPRPFHHVSEDVLPVWDVDKSAWRSFRIDSIDMYLTKRID
jgi:hypothetical protein